MQNVLADLASSFTGHGDPSREPPYVRYVAPDLDELDSRVEYDLEDDDTAWLTTVRRTVQRPLRQSLTEDLLERLIDRFEKELHAAVVRQPHLWSTDDSGPGRGHVQLDVAAVYPKEKALQVCSDLLAVTSKGVTLKRSQVQPSVLFYAFLLSLDSTWPKPNYVDTAVRTHVSFSCLNLLSTPSFTGWPAPLQEDPCFTDFCTAAGS